jgi:alpha-beta hydrolase superfamily lysophospholipase
MITPISWSAVLNGTLFTFGNSTQHLTAFHSGPVSTPNAMVLLPGLTEGQLSLPWTTRIADTIAQRGWSTVHPTISSSYLGFGTGSLERDTSELDLLLDELVKQGKKHIMLVGHSTGKLISIAVYNGNKVN